MSEPIPNAPRCFGAGLVVNGTKTIPDDLAVYRHAEDDYTPCNQLWCETCKIMVKNVAGYDLNRPWHTVSAETAARLYDGQDPSSSDVLRNRFGGQHNRVYFCRCSSYGVAGPRPMETDGPVCWSCHGHPQS